ncbi:hypothetical protein [Nostoc sp.]|uniref:hypothetical protein n=1 Tax=Nostoc sp. TaxID=1180 RepID=UPI002FF97533
MCKIEEGSPDETSFTALNERITGDWGLGTSIFIQHSALSSQEAEGRGHWCQLNVKASLELAFRLPRSQSPTLLGLI